MVAGLQATERNDRGGRGIPRNLSASGVIMFLGFQKALSERSGKSVGCATTGAKFGAKFA